MSFSPVALLRARGEVWGGMGVRRRGGLALMFGCGRVAEVDEG